MRQKRRDAQRSVELTDLNGDEESATGPLLHVSLRMSLRTVCMIESQRALIS
jgi:hypothetical protein